MILSLECLKLKRTGFFPAILTGGVLSSMIPAVNMAVRSGTFTSLPGNPLVILLNANWQLMAMLNLLVVICGTCIMYHTEYSDNALQKMQALPCSQFSLFLGKFGIMALSSLLCILLEFLSVAFCALHWFPGTRIPLTELAETAGYAAFLMLPACMLMLVIASACRNMWISLGTGVFLLFAATLIPDVHTIVSLFPFAMPFSIFPTGGVSLSLLAAGAETALFFAAEPVYLTVRRSLS